MSHSLPHALCFPDEELDLFLFPFHVSPLPFQTSLARNHQKKEAENRVHVEKQNSLKQVQKAEQENQRVREQLEESKSSIQKLKEALEGKAQAFALAWEEKVRRWDRTFFPVLVWKNFPDSAEFFAVANGGESRDPGETILAADPDHEARDLGV